MKLKFLGTANGAGIPAHSCSCTICKEHRKNKRINLSTSAYIELKDNSIILIDAGFENIATIFDKKRIRAVFLTHFHPDHSIGLIRLRYSAQEIVCFHPEDNIGCCGLFKHKLSIKYIRNTPFKEIYIDDAGIKFTPIPLIHSKNTTGYLIETKETTVAYLTDCAAIPAASLNFLKNKNIDYIFIDATLSPNSKADN
jgi:phosphoribosyl 1,2-cyclic phosphate phosphodiesterase